MWIVGCLDLAELAQVVVKALFMPGGDESAVPAHRAVMTGRWRCIAVHIFRGSRRTFGSSATAS